MKNYKFGNKSDMRRLQKDLESKAKNIIENVVWSKSYEVECPRCHQKVEISPESPICPKCRNLIRVQFNTTYTH